MLGRMRFVRMIAVILMFGGFVAGCQQLQSGQPSGAQRPPIEDRDSGEGMGMGASGGM